MRVAIGAVIQESNHFVPAACTLAQFQASYLCRGREIPERLAGTRTEVSGFLAACARQGVETVPLLAAHSVSYGPLTQETFAYLRGELLTALAQAGPIDGVLLALHGAMAVADDGDPEGTLLAAVRTLVGDRPVAVTMDLHAHVTPAMIEAADVIIGYRHYPHDDAYETGERAAELLVRTLTGEVHPVLCMAKAPMIVPVGNMQTAFGPMADLMAAARTAEAAGPVLAASCFGVQPWLDLPDMGFACVVVADGDITQARAHAARIAAMAWERRQAFTEELIMPEAAIRRALNAPAGTVVLCDSADSPGAGSSGDGTAVLEALLAAQVTVPCLLSVVDPEAAGLAVAAGVGSRLELSVGNRMNRDRGAPTPVVGIVCAISDGRFRYTGGLLGGVEGNMGPTAVLAAGPIQILIASRSTYEWDDAQYRSVGLRPDRARIVVVKMPLNYKFTYETLSRTMMVLDTPGPASPNLRALPYRRIARPLFPFDDECPQGISLWPPSP